MRDAGLCDAIDAAAGAVQLAPKIGVAQRSASNLNRAPDQRVIAIEAATGVSCQQVRSDRYSELAVEDDPIDPVDAARAREYALLAALLSCPPSDVLLREIRELRGDETPLGRAHAALAEAYAGEPFVHVSERAPSGNISICSSVSGAASYCPMRHII